MKILSSEEKEAACDEDLAEEGKSRGNFTVRVAGCTGENEGDREKQEIVEAECASVCVSCLVLQSMPFNAGCACVRAAWTQQCHNFHPGLFCGRISCRREWCKGERRGWKGDRDTKKASFSFVRFQRGVEAAFSQMKPQQQTNQRHSNKWISMLSWAAATDCCCRGLLGFVYNFHSNVVLCFDGDVGFEVVCLPGNFDIGKNCGVTIEMVPFLSLIVGI